MIEVLENDYNIVEKICSLTTDRGKNMILAKDLFVKEMIKKGKIKKNTIFYNLDCLAH